MGYSSKMLFGLALGVGAVAAAPFTGGGSVFGAATLFGSLAGAGTMATGAGAVGAAVGAIIANQEENEEYEQRKKDQETGFRNGYTQGSTDTLEKLRNKILENNKLKLGVFALACHISKIDGDFSDAEREEIESIIGRPDSMCCDPGLKEEFYSIMNADMSFDDIANKYFDGIDTDTYEELDELVKDIVKADGRKTKEEQDFLDNDWKIMQMMCR